MESAFSTFGAVVNEMRASKGIDKTVVMYHEIQAVPGQPNAFSFKRQFDVLCRSKAKDEQGPVSMGNIAAFVSTLLWKNNYTYDLGGEVDPDWPHATPRNRGCKS